MKTSDSFVCRLWTVNAMVVFFAFWCFEGCALWQKPAGSADSEKAEMSNEQIAGHYGEEAGANVAELRSRREAALAAPKDLNAALSFSNLLFDLLLTNYGQINGVDWKQYSRDAIKVLESSSASPSAPPEQAADALALRANFLGGFNEVAASIQSMRDGFARAHTYQTGLGMVKVHGSEKNFSEAQKMCESTRPLAINEEKAFDLIETCLGAVESKNSSKEALPWVSEEDWDMFERRYQERADARLATRNTEAERRQATQEEEAASAAAAPPTGTGKSSSPSRPAWVSFTLRNTCPNTVKLFYGTTPKFGSGRSSSIGGNTSQGESMNEGDMIWITDDSGNGLSNFSASKGVRQVEINSSCTSFIAH